MPDGKTHEIFRIKYRIFSYFVFLVFTIFLLIVPMRPGGQWLIGVGMFVGYEIGRFCSPDWDCVTATADEARMINNIPIVGHFLFGISSTYGSIFRRHHRSFITHFPLISTSIRYVIIFWWLWYEIYWSTLDWAWLIFIFIGMFIGTSMSDAIHWWADMVKYPKSE